MTDLHTILKEKFGYDQFRPGQEEIIHYILQGENVLGIMPTGGGKSVCYQLPALLLDGLTLVVSPLISLMKDQVDALRQMDIPATFINSTLDPLAINERLRQAASGEIKLLYIAPERLETYDFQQMLHYVPVNLLAIDEAHCISQWGHDFRPSYLKVIDTIAQFQQTPVIVALTATATPQVAEDIGKLLNISADHQVQTGFARENLSFRVLKDQQRDLYLLEYLKLNAEQSGIIYASTRKEVERLYLLLKKHNLRVGRYHGGMHESDRAQNQDDFLFDRTHIMVATNAFGMGINKSNIRFVIHAQIPGNLESYYQEAGRAGRDGLPSEVVLLYAPQDLQIQKFFIEQSEQGEEYKQQEYSKLRSMDQYAHTQQCLQRYILNYFGEKQADCGQCGNCLDDREYVDITVDAQKVLSCVRRMGERFGKSLVGKVLTGSKDQKIVQWKFDRLSTYGLLKDRTQKEVSQLIDYLTAADYLDVTDGQYPALKVSERGIQVLMGELTVGRKQEQKAHRLMDDDQLFSALKALRTDLASEQNVPPYVIFSDQALRDMCTQRPHSSIEFLQIKGVGQNKLNKYGKDFIQLIKQIEADQPEVIEKTGKTLETSDL